jgi:cellulose synthase/poly-beta-1,6-N-acetylglucosamine synthase-like glycosyltransferase
LDHRDDSGRVAEEFTIGICAADENPAIASLAKSLLDECDATHAPMRKMVIVASSCPDDTVSSLGTLQQNDVRVDLLIEGARHGKADAVNKILGRSATPLLLLVNSDSRPEPGALSHLLSSMEADEKIGAVSAIPEPRRRDGLISLLLGLMWSAHNNCSVTLNHMNVANHSCDELVLFRTKAISLLPQGTVNDGAFLAATARLRGYSIRVSTAAKVGIRTPTRISDVILQRRRILYGHAQVWRLFGTPPKTVESLLFLSPAIGMRFLISTLASRPRSLLVIPIAIVSEVTATLLSILDTLRATRAHTIWRRFR